MTADDVTERARQIVTGAMFGLTTPMMVDAIVSDLDAAGLLVTETWRDVPGYEGRYEVSDLGNVRSWAVRGEVGSRRATPRTLSQATGKRGRKTVSLVPEGASAGRTHTVHGLVASAFIGPRPEGMQVAHWDGDAGNNRLSNLRYATPEENSADAIRHETLMRGSRHTSARLTEAEVLGVSEALDRGERQIDVALRHGVSKQVVNDIRLGRTWGWLTGRSSNDGMSA